MRGLARRRLVELPVLPPAARPRNPARERSKGKWIGISPVPACRRDQWRREGFSARFGAQPCERGLHRGGKLLEIERLLQEHKVLVLGEVLAEGVLGIAGDEDDLEVGALAAELLEQSRPVHLGHHHVAHHEIDLALVAGEDFERLGAGGGFEHVIAALAERAGGEAPDRVLVLDEQHGAAARSGPSASRDGRSIFSGSASATASI